MSLLLELARASVGANLLMLSMLGYVWGRNYLDHGARHTLALLVFSGFLVVQNLVWGYLYVIDIEYVEWFVGSEPSLQLALTLLCGLETAALAFLTWITWR
ncbi:MAG: hypothetical protein PPP58_10465 [Natronomonas sp.]